MLKKYKEIILYLIFGFGTTGVNWLSYSCAVKLFGLSIFIGNIVSWILATAFAFVTNKIWVFESKTLKGKMFWDELGKFVSARLITGGLEVILVPLLVYLGLNQEIFGIEGIVSKILVSILIVILNYFISKFYIFKDKALK